MPAERIDYKKLIDAAINSLGTYYGPNPGHAYGSSVLTEHGKIYAASNYSSATASLTLHAEQAALAHAAMHGDPNVIAIVTVSKRGADKKTVSHPCGMCKQLIWENSVNSGKKIAVVMANLKGGYVVKEISRLVPYPWPTKGGV